MTPGNTPTSTLRTTVPAGSSPSWRRSRSLSDTEKTLDDAIRELDSLQVNITDDLEVARRHRHYSSNDSAMGESEVVMSPAPSAGSEPSTLNRARDVTRNRSDSAFSNNTSPTDSSNEGGSDAMLLVDSSSNSASFIHQRNASTLSSTSEPGRQPGDSSHAHLGSAQPHPPLDSVSLPTFSPERELERDVSLLPHERSVADIASSSLNKHRKAPPPTPPKKWKLRTMPSVTSSGTYSPSRSPVLRSRGVGRSTEALDETTSEGNPTPTPPTITTSTLTHSSDTLPAVGSGSLSDEGTVI